MRLNIKFSFLFLLLILTFAGCGDENEPTLSINYITDYVYDVNNLILSVVQPNEASMSILVIADGTRTKQGERRFNEYARQLNDESFNQPEEKCFSVACIAEPFDAIEVVTLKNYNDNYPAGSTINNIMEISYLLPRKVISSGYDLSENTSEMNNLTDFNESNPHVFTSYTFELKFKVKPLVSGVYDFVFRYRKATGEVVEKSLFNVALQN